MDGLKLREGVQGRRVRTERNRYDTETYTTVLTGGQEVTRLVWNDKFSVKETLQTRLRWTVSLVIERDAKVSRDAL